MRQWKKLTRYVVRPIFPVQQVGHLISWKFQCSEILNSTRRYLTFKTDVIKPIFNRRKPLETEIENLEVVSFVRVQLFGVRNPLQQLMN